MAGKPTNDLREKILAATLAQAARVGFAQVRLFDVADELGISLAELRRHYRDLDAVGDAWLARGDGAMLAARDAPGFADLAPRERLFRAIMAFLDALAPHRQATGQIFRAKLYFGHPHHNIALLLWTSRTVQWLREAANLSGADRRKRIEEIGLSGLFLATLWRWVNDDSDNQQRTRDWLTERLAQGERVMRRWFPESTLPASPPPGRKDRSKRR
jgi:AcrR family transcriptional regulator